MQRSRLNWRYERMRVGKQFNFQVNSRLILQQRGKPSSCPMLIPLQYPVDRCGPPQGHGALWCVVPHWGCNSEYRSHHLAVQCCSFFDHQLEHFQGPDAPFVPGIKTHHAEVTLTCQALWLSVATTYFTTCWSLGTCSAVQKTACFV